MKMFVVFDSVKCKKYYFDTIQSARYFIDIKKLTTYQLYTTEI